MHSNFAIRIGFLPLIFTIGFMANPNAFAKSGSPSLESPSPQQRYNMNCVMNSGAQNPLDGLRNGVVVSFSGIGHQTIMRTDFDLGLLSTLTSSFGEPFNGHPTTFYCSHDVRLTTKDLTEIKSITDSIRDSAQQFSPSRGGLDASWEIYLVADGAAWREGGLGIPGGLGQKLGGVLATISGR